MRFSAGQCECCQTSRRRKSSNGERCPAGRMVTGKSTAARRIFAEKAAGLRCSPVRDRWGILPRRASPASLFLENWRPAEFSDGLQACPARSLPRPGNSRPAARPPGPREPRRTWQACHLSAYRRMIVSLSRNGWTDFVARWATRRPVNGSNKSAAFGKCSVRSPAPSAFRQR